MYNLSICIITYKRPKGLNNVLESLSKIALSNEIKIEIIVVDNDEEKSAYDIVSKWSNLLPVFYFYESKKGIPFARNKAVRSSSKDSHYILFIDDDEMASENWIIELLKVAYNKEADVVAGPVLPIFSIKPKNWILRGKYFEIPPDKFKDEERIYEAQTGNILINKKIFDEEDICFDEKLINTGGTDTLLFMMISKKGYRIHWSSKAVVYETTPKSRVNLKWILKRSFRHGITITIARLRTEQSIKTYLVQLIKGIGWILVGILYLPKLILGFHHLVNALRFMMRGIGNIVATAGIKYNEYKHTHTV